MHPTGHLLPCRCARASRRATPWPGVAATLLLLLLGAAAGPGLRTARADDDPTAAPDAELLLLPAAPEALLGEPLVLRVTARWDAARYDHARVELPPASLGAALHWDWAEPPHLAPRGGRLEGVARVRGWLDGAWTLDAPRLVLLEGLTPREVPPAEPPLLRVLLAGVGEGAAADALLGSLLPPPTPLERARPYVLGALAALGLGLAALAAVRWARQPRPEVVPGPAAWALAELERLGAAPREGRAGIVAFHFRLADVLRAFCGRRWVFYSARMTTSELDRALVAFAPDLGSERRAALMALLEAADEVKFALGAVDDAACRDRLDAARALVASTGSAVVIPPRLAPPPTPGAPEREAA